MIYTATISTPITTSESNRQRTSLAITKGLVYKVEIAFPPGSMGLLHVILYDGAHQLWPSTPGENFYADSYTLEFEDLHLKLVPPWEFQIETWNNDDTHEHALQIRIGMVDKEIFMARYLPSMAYEQLIRMIAEETRKQEEQRAIDLEAARLEIEEITRESE
ncbi:hypothetical protein LCGC14_1513550 [marine sediment metagenome]|uniref:Uncharacterized protein n=1 Tax=marine sediment metagenome TaxID=412755 RepID=A0A0F9J0X5_9ZZZZ